MRMPASIGRGWSESSRRSGRDVCPRAHQAHDAAAGLVASADNTPTAFPSRGATAASGPLSRWSAGGAGASLRECPSGIDLPAEPGGCFHPVVACTTPTLVHVEPAVVDFVVPA